MATIQFFGKDFTIMNCLDLILLGLVIILEFQLGRCFVYSPFLRVILL